MSLYVSNMIAASSVRQEPTCSRYNDIHMVLSTTTTDKAAVVVVHNSESVQLIA